MVNFTEPFVSRKIGRRFRRDFLEEFTTTRSVKSHEKGQLIILESVGVDPMSFLSNGHLFLLKLSIELGWQFVNLFNIILTRHAPLD